MKTMMDRLFRRAPFVLAALALLSVAGAWTLDRFAAQEVQLVVTAAPEEVELNRALWAPGDPVASIYGVPAGEPMRVLFVANDRLVHPAEDSSITLLPIDKQAGDNPLQVRTVWFLAWRLAAGFGIASLGVGGLLLMRRRCLDRRCAVSTPR